MDAHRKTGNRFHRSLRADREKTHRGNYTGIDSIKALYKLVCNTKPCATALGLRLAEMALGSWNCQKSVEKIAGYDIKLERYYGET
jgi:hypothetical protein